LQQTHLIARAYRISLIIFHVLLGLSISFLLLPFVSKHVRLGLTRWWCKRLMRCFRIEVHTEGALPDEQTISTMFVANHISWSDIHAINSVIPVRFIAKVEIKSWPVFGYLVSKSGTLFINRSIRRDAARIINLTTHSLRDGDNVCLFPEGTTTNGTDMLPFKASILQAAIQAKAAIWPIAISYPKPDGQANLDMAFVGEATMMDSMAAILRIKEPVVKLHFLAPFSCDDIDRHQATKRAYEHIKAQLTP
jgi:1-acyl-sn-glycerol-3-phosphate acyltransferase